MKKLRISINAKPVQIEQKYDDITQVIGVWEGNNFIVIIQRLIQINVEMKVKVQGSRLIIKDEEKGFYSALQKGDKVRIPVYFKRVRDVEIEEMERLRQEAIEADRPRVEGLLREWGLMND